MSGPPNTILGLTIVEFVGLLGAVSGLLLGIFGHLAGLWGKNRETKVKESEILANQEREFRKSILDRLTASENLAKEQSTKINEQALKIAQLQGTVDAMQARETSLLADLAAAQARESKLIAENASLKTTMEAAQRNEQAALLRVQELSSQVATYRACPQHTNCPFHGLPQKGGTEDVNPGEF